MHINMSQTKGPSKFLQLMCSTHTFTANEKKLVLMKSSLPNPYPPLTSAASWRCQVFNNKNKSVRVAPNMGPLSDGP